jgi:hypothetical protein
MTFIGCPPYPCAFTRWVLPKCPPMRALRLGKNPLDLRDRHVEVLVWYMVKDEPADHPTDRCGLQWDVEQRSDLEGSLTRFPELSENRVRLRRLRLQEAQQEGTPAAVAEQGRRCGELRPSGHVLERRWIWKAVGARNRPESLLRCCGRALMLA